MKYWIISIMAAAVLLTVLSVTLTCRQWNKRGGLKVVFFSDRISKNAYLIAVSVLIVCVPAVYFIDVYLLLAENTISSLPSSVGLFLPVFVFTILSSVEGQYGRGLYLRKNSLLVPITAVEIETVGDKIVFMSAQQRYTRYFVSSTSNRESFRSLMNDSSTP